MTTDIDFVVTDVETTGPFPNGNDRIIEIAVIRIDSNGNIKDEYDTLINPHRDLGDIYTHGITARDVKYAPVFSEIAGDLLSILAGAIFVAHNVGFDMRFVRAELARVGCELPEFPHLCTMQLARRADPDIPCRNLGGLCKYFGIELSRWHRAYDDAKATAELLTKCISKLTKDSTLSLMSIGVKGEIIGGEYWPVLPVGGKRYPREKAVSDIASEPSYMQRLLFKLPVMTYSQPQVDEYMSLLDRVLEDRRVSAEESDALFALAEELGMSRQQSVDAHYSYMRQLISIALEDSVITDSERRDLDTVRQLLAIPDSDFTTMMHEAIRQLLQSGKVERPQYLVDRLDVEGKSICFTGELNCHIKGIIASRPITASLPLAQMIAMQRGMVVKERVTKGLDFLAAADPDSMSVKARKAREYGVRIIAEPVFWQMMGIQIE